MDVRAWCLGLCVFGVGCQPAKQAWVPGKTDAPVQSSDLTAQWERSRELGLPLEIEARVTRLGSDEALASLRGKLDTRGAMVFETSERDQPSLARLSVHVEPRKDGGYALGVSWDERAPEGRVVSWHPNLVLERGAATTAEIAWADGDGRRLSLRIVDPAAEQTAPVAAVEPAGAAVEASAPVAASTSSLTPGPPPQAAATTP
jgi:hypothetical protein